MRITGFRFWLIPVICGWMILIGIREGGKVAWGDEGALAFDFRPTTLTVFSAVGTKRIGQVHYSSSKSDGADVVRGEASYVDGIRELELEYLKPGKAGQAPTLMRHEYSSFNPDGSPQFIESLDPVSGDASCTAYENGSPQFHRAKLTAPSDTYAGATQMMFVVAALRQGVRETIKFHSFNCIPTPKIVQVAVSVPTDREEWRMYPGQLAKLELEPDFGWIDVLIAPFLPKIHAWVDPNDNWNYVGAIYDRFYKGPHIMTVRDGTH